MRKLCSVLCAHVEVFPSILNEDATLGGGTDKQSLYVVDRAGSRGLEIPSNGCGVNARGRSGLRGDILHGVEAHGEVVETLWTACGHIEIEARFEHLALHGGLHLFG